VKKLLLFIILACVLIPSFAFDTRFLHFLVRIGSAPAYAIKEDHELIYVRNQNQVWIYSTFNAWQPKLESSFYSVFPIEDLETHDGNYLYLASREPTNQILPVDSLNAGTKIFFPCTILGDKMTREGATLYVADRFKGIDIVNIGGGSIREILATFSEKWGIRDFVANYPYIFALNDFGLVAVDISDQSNPRSIATNYQLNDATCLVKNGNTLWIGAGKNLLAFNVFNPEKPSLITQYRMTNDILNLDIKDNRLFVVQGRGGVKIMDVTNPLKATDLNAIQTDYSVYDIALANDYVFLALGKDGWMIYEYR